MDHGLPRLFKAAFLILAAAAFGIFLNVGIVFASGRAESQGLQTEVFEAATPPERLEHVPSRAEQVARALVEAYPRRVERAEFRDGDWAVLLRDTWFYYADGRLLPQEMRNRASDYSPIAFYNYPRELPPWTEPNPEQGRQLRERSNQRATTERPRAHYFFDALYRAHSRDEAHERVKTLRFLGFPILVHYAILEDLSLVEERILAAARTDAQVRYWINNIASMQSWTWRNMAGSQSRSFHSYGTAIDILPRAYGGREIFWQWAGPNWWSIPYERRYHPPEAVIRAFESYGFVWGGKWLFFDAMHFEYRPEVFILNELELLTLR